MGFFYTILISRAKETNLGPTLSIMHELQTQKKIIKITKQYFFFGPPCFWPPCPFAPCISPPPILSLCNLIT